MSTPRPSRMEPSSFPPSAYCILFSELFERFHHFGIRAILTLYLYQDMRYSPNTATIVYHLYEMVEKSVCIIGIFLSESCIGKFATIVLALFVDLCGIVILTLGSIPPVDIAVKVGTMVGLTLVAVATGCGKPCVTGFCNDQFKGTHPPEDITDFLSLMFFFATISAMFSSLIVPVLHKDMNCFGDTECYPLSFAVSTGSLLIAIAFFLLGSCAYKKLRSQKNYLLLMMQLCCRALINKCCRRKTTGPRQHWLEYADDKYEKSLIEDGKIVFRILVIHMPFPILWSMIYQQGSRWVLQATHMNSRHGSWKIRPDQIIMLNPLFVLTLMPICDLLLYPVLNLLKLETTLNKLVLGGLLVMISFLISSGIIYHLESVSPDLPMPHLAQLRIFNGEQCSYSVTTNIPNMEQFNVESLHSFTFENVPVDSGTFDVQLTFTKKDGDECFAFGTQTITMNGGGAHSLFLGSKNVSRPTLWYSDYVLAPLRSSPLIRILMNSANDHSVKFKDVDETQMVMLTFQSESYKLHEIPPATYEILIDNVLISNMIAHDGGVYTLIIRDDNAKGTFEINKIQVVPPYDLPMLWMIPQYLCMTLGEVLCTGTALEFSYLKSPKHMRIVLHVCWLLNVAMGNALVAVVTAMDTLDSMAYEGILFASLMCINLFVFYILARIYNPNDLVTQTYMTSEYSQ